MDFKKHCLCYFGEYVEYRVDYVVINYIRPRKNEAISLGPSHNLQGTHIVFCLETGLVIKQRVNMVVPIPNRVIKKVWEKINFSQPQQKRI